MSEVNWDENAKAAAMEFACYIGKAKDCKKYFEHIEPKQTKTVEDAVEAFPKGYNSIPYTPEYIEKEQVVLCAKKSFFDDGEEYAEGNLYQGQKDFDSEYFYQVCTREQFEACAAKKSEKWTHTYGHAGYKCKVISVDGEHSWILTENGDKLTEYTSSLEPIKPTISQADCELLVKFKKHIADSDKSRLDDMLDDFIDMHDII